MMCMSEAIPNDQTTCVHKWNLYPESHTYTLYTFTELINQ